jgi:hypothetical protein
MTMTEQEQKTPSADKPWYTDPGCLIVIVILAVIIWWMHATYNPNAPDPYADDPLSDPDLYHERWDR